MACVWSIFDERRSEFRDEGAGLCAIPDLDGLLPARCRYLSLVLLCLPICAQREPPGMVLEIPAGVSLARKSEISPFLLVCDACAVLLVLTGSRPSG